MRAFEEDGTVANLPDEFFIKLSPSKERTFRAWARTNFLPGKAASGLWHPIIRGEWAKLQREHDSR